MQNHLTWQYDEFHQVGKDYADPSEVAVYDATHSQFRDLEAEGNAILDTLALNPGDTLVDFGCGTGNLAILAARRGIRVRAVDVSEAMLGYAREKTSKVGAENIEFIRAGFLTYDHNGEPADAISSTFVLHHLPDFWKGVALARLHAMLKPGGLFYLHDVVLADDDALDHIRRFIDRQDAAGGTFLREDAEQHFREEFSTYDWVMEGLLTRVGFTIQSKSLDDGVLGTYRCVRKRQT
jgi:cyclopropane fatty-acyl-phospholipid synthase-like methyltransferase